MDHRTHLPLAHALLALLLGLLPQGAMATGGTQGQNSPGNVSNSASGPLWLNSSPASVKAGGGSRYQPESLGKVNTHENVTWRKDGLGNIKGSDGSIYRPNSLGQFDRNGKTSLPVYQQGK